MTTDFKTDTEVLIIAMRHWAKVVLSNGGVAADTISQGADRLQELQARAEKAEKLWKEFITLMEITEESDSGNEFNPNKISSCRAMDGKRLNEILNEARQIVFLKMSRQVSKTDEVTMPPDIEAYLKSVPPVTPEMIARVAAANRAIEEEDHNGPQTK